MLEIRDGRTGALDRSGLLEFIIFNTNFITFSIQISPCSRRCAGWAARGTAAARAAKSILFNTKFIVFDAEFLV